MIHIHSSGSVSLWLINTGLWLVEVDHVTWILVPDWRLIPSMYILFAASKVIIFYQIVFTPKYVSVFPCYVCVLKIIFLMGRLNRDTDLSIYGSTSQQIAAWLTVAWMILWIFIVFSDVWHRHFMLKAFCANLNLYHFLLQLYISIEFLSVGNKLEDLH